MLPPGYGLTILIGGLLPALLRHSSQRPPVTARAPSAGSPTPGLARRAVSASPSRLAHVAEPRQSLRQRPSRAVRLSTPAPYGLRRRLAIERPASCPRPYTNRPTAYGLRQRPRRGVPGSRHRLMRRSAYGLRSGLRSSVQPLALHPCADRPTTFAPRAASSVRPSSRHTIGHATAAPSNLTRVERRQC